MQTTEKNSLEREISRLKGMIAKRDDEIS